MAIQKLKYNDTFVYFDDDMDDTKKGYAIHKEEKDDLENTMEFVPFNEKDLLEDTIVDSNLFGDSDEK